MSTKDDAIAKLKKAGYQVVDDNAVLTVLVPVNTIMKTTVKDIKNKLSEYGYEESFGIKQIKTGSVSNANTIIKEQEEIKTEEEENEEEQDSFEPGEDGGQFSLGDFGIGI